MNVTGLIQRQSRYSAKETTDRLAAGAAAHGLHVFARVDHAAGAAAIGMALRPTEVLIFGAAKAGTPLMQTAQTLGIDLPLKALVFEDEAGQVFIAWNDPAWLAARHGVSGQDALVAAMTTGLETLAKEAGG